MGLPRYPEGHKSTQGPEERTATQHAIQIGCGCLMVILGIILFGVLASAGLWVIVNLVQSLGL